MQFCSSVATVSDKAKREKRENNINLPTHFGLMGSISWFLWVDGGVFPQILDTLPWQWRSFMTGAFSGQGWNRKIKKKKSSSQSILWLTEVLCPVFCLVKHKFASNFYFPLLLILSDKSHEIKEGGQKQVKPRHFPSFSSLTSLPNHLILFICYP